LSSRLINEPSKNSKSRIHNTIKWIHAGPDPQPQNLSRHTIPYLITESGSNKNGKAPGLVLSLLQKYFENKWSKNRNIVAREGSGSCYFFHWPSRCQQNKIFV